MHAIRSDFVRAHCIHHTSPSGLLLVSSCFWYVSQCSVQFRHAAKGARRSTASLGETKLSADEKASLQDLIGDGGFYRVRLVPTGDVDQKTPVPMAAVPACALQASGYRELITFQTDIYGRVAGMTYKPPMTSCADLPPAKAESMKFRTKTAIAMGRTGEKPKPIRSGQFDKLSSQSGGSEGGKAKPGGKQKEEPKTFFQKYWMYIGAFVLYVFMQMLNPPDEAGQGGGAKGGKAQ